MKAEEKGKLIISSWLNENGFTIYWEKKNQYSYPIFKTIGMKGKKPDLLLYSSLLNSWIAIEFKSPFGRNIRESDKIINYCTLSKEGKIKYSVDNKEVIPLVFLVATEYSKEGKLFYDDNTIKRTLDINTARTWGVPLIEYTRTHDFSRNLIKLWKIEDRDKKYSVGILLSLNKEPYIFFMTYTNKWGHKFWKI